MFRVQGFRAIAAGLIVTSALLAVPARAEGNGRLVNAYTSDSRETQEEKSTFATTVPKIYVFYQVVEAPKGTKISAVWYAEKVPPNPDNTKIIESVSTSPGTDAIAGVFSYTPAAGGFTPGAYRVDVSLAGHIEKSVRFKIGK